MVGTEEVPRPDPSCLGHNPKQFRFATRGCLTGILFNDEPRREEVEQLGSTGTDF